MNSLRANKLSFKFQKLTPLGCKNIMNFKNVVENTFYSFEMRKIKK